MAPATRLRGRSATRPAAIAGLRMAAQRISATTFVRPAEAIAWLGAVQAQDYLGALWAVGLRLAGAREADVEAALADGSIVRTWPIRGTLHFVAAADARWILDLLAPSSVAGAAGRFRALGLDDETFARARRALAGRLERDGRLARSAVYDVLERAKVSTEGQRGIHILWRLAHEKFLCFGPREGKQQTFVLFDAWVKEAKGERPFTRDEALGELARRYFTSHGPATATDFAWWSGLKLSDARRAIQRAESHLVHEAIAERAYWLAEPRAVASVARAPRTPRRRVVLLPAFDEFVVGYSDRSAVLHETRKLAMNRGGGMLNPAVVVDGQIVGTWKRAIAGGKVAFAPSFFEPLADVEARAVASAFRRYADFLGLDVRGAA